MIFYRFSMISLKIYRTYIFSILFNLNLTNSVRTWWRVISCCRVGSSNTMAVINNLLNFTGWTCFPFFETKYLNFIILVLKNLQFLFIIQKVHTLAPINFKHAHVEPDIFFRLCDFENIIDSVFGYGVNCECFSWPCLTVRKTCNNCALKYHGQQISDRKFIHVLWVLIFVECVIEFKVNIIDVFGNAINFDLRLMHHNLWIGHAHTIDDSLCVLFIK